MIGMLGWFALLAYLFGAVFAFGWVVGLQDAAQVNDRTRKETAAIVVAAAVTGAVWFIIPVGSWVGRWRTRGDS